MNRSWQNLNFLSTRGLTLNENKEVELKIDGDPFYRVGLTLLLSCAWGVLSWSIIAGISFSRIYTKLKIDTVAVRSQRQQVKSIKSYKYIKATLWKDHFFKLDLRFWDLTVYTRLQWVLCDSAESDWIYGPLPFFGPRKKSGWLTATLGRRFLLLNWSRHEKEDSPSEDESRLLLQAVSKFCLEQLPIILFKKSGTSHVAFLWDYVVWDRV